MRIELPPRQEHRRLPSPDTCLRAGPVTAESSAIREVERVAFRFSIPSGMNSFEILAETEFGFRGEPSGSQIITARSARSAGPWVS